MANRQPKLRISLKTFLTGLSVLVLLLPIAGIQVLRIYESALVRQTESALIAQAAFITAMYRTLVIEQGTQNWDTMSRPLHVAQTPPGEGWLPRPAELDLATSVLLPAFPDGLTQATAHPYAARVGQRLHPVLKDAQLTTLAGIRVVDPWGVIIATTGEDLGQDISAGVEVAAALQGMSISRIRQKNDVVSATPAETLSRTSKIRVFVSSPIVLHNRLVGAVLLSRTPPSILQALYGKRWLLAQAAAFLLLTAIAMALLTYRLMARPIQRLAHQAEQISSGEHRGMAAISRHHSPRVKEVAQLQDAIVEMARTLENRAAYLQDFARHISHEFKTPLASIRGAIEVLGDHRHDMDDAQYQQFVQNITDDANRLQLLTERLNVLARADLAQAEIAPHNIKPLCKQVMQDFPNLHITLDPSLDQAVMQLDANGMCAALEVLLENAAQHEAQQVTIKFIDEQLQICDDGVGISAGNQEKIFEPFFTTRRNDGGTGLGLTIAQALLSQSNAQLSLVQAAKPTVFGITSQ